MPSERLVCQRTVDILAAGKAVPVAAVDRGPAQLLVVRDEKVRRPLQLYGQSRGDLGGDRMDPRVRLEMILKQNGQVKLKAKAKV